VDGTPEVVTDGVSGRLVPPAQPVALAHALRAVLRDPAAARRMGQAGRRRVLARFDIDRHVEATARVYRSAAA
ncbi:MAG TPA: glycosyltransferase, partial [Methylomirabilota bacterium]|nr:glycosyltransferase [Methylomirabilota bacterium]